MAGLVPFSEALRFLTTPLGPGAIKLLALPNAYLQATEFSEQLLGGFSSYSNAVIPCMYHRRRPRSKSSSVIMHNIYCEKDHVPSLMHRIVLDCVSRIYYQNNSRRLWRRSSLHHVRPLAGSRLQPLSDDHSSTSPHPVSPKQPEMRAKLRRDCIRRQKDEEYDCWPKSLASSRVFSD